jgi:hypothetical protein
MEADHTKVRGSGRFTCSIQLICGADATHSHPYHRSVDKQPGGEHGSREIDGPGELAYHESKYDNKKTICVRPGPCPVYKRSGAASRMRPRHLRTQTLHKMDHKGGYNLNDVFTLSCPIQHAR